jgi:quercetin dioxygenase-like cupin family protein
MIHRKADKTKPSPISAENACGIRYARLIGVEHGAPTVVLRHFEVDAGGHTPRHAHPWEHEVYILTGSGTLRTEGTETVLSPGDSVLVLPNEIHQFSAGPEGMGFLCIVPPEGDTGLTYSPGS